MPPSYEEVIEEKKLEESYDEWDHSNEFSPKYPVYSFDANAKNGK